MTNVATYIENIADRPNYIENMHDLGTTTCQTTLFQWVAMSGWIVLLVCLIVLLVNLFRQAILLRRPDGQFFSERISATGIVWGWVSLMVGIGMTWYGLHNTWAAGELGRDVSQNLLLVCYDQSSISGFIGFLLWSGAFSEEAFFRRLWMRKSSIGRRR